MQLFTLLLAAAATLASAGQVNFYSDSNCQNYLDHRFPGSFSITGFVLTLALPIVANITMTVALPVPNPPYGSQQTRRRVAAPAVL
jgi:hypothetical protein